VKFKKGDLVKHEDLNWVFRVAGITTGKDFTPDGWLISNSGEMINPRGCKKYEGAESAISDK